ncbi:hypothetical protein K505DRAFT_334587 [Melanomma pulvis-pyrius CBS 109.77]|uniref:Uncharacterized protein n=1 Tax=Melanomma pulvis-pyrius CBS 109.77 TaxID=1314802 RepID=A0A6A6XKW5_9PLEO|nr:hypothetical protein K505DRAFT_334587 [Melanomma pulvis-pyrius CBS 109.77]
MPSDIELPVAGKTAKEALQFIPELWQQIAYRINRNDVVSVRLLPESEVERGWEGIIKDIAQWADEKYGMTFDQVSHRIGIPDCQTYELVIRTGSKNTMSAGFTVKEELREEFGEAITNFMMCDFTINAFLKIIEHIMCAVDSKAKVHWFRTIPQPERMFKTSREELRDPPHSVFLIETGDEKYIVDLSRTQYGIPSSEWFVPEEYYKQHWISQEDEHKGAVHWIVTEVERTHMKDQLEQSGISANDEDLICDAIGSVFEKWKAQGGDMEVRGIEQFSKNILDAVEEAKLHIARRYKAKVEEAVQKATKLEVERRRAIDEIIAKLRAARE